MSVTLVVAHLLHLGNHLLHRFANYLEDALFEKLVVHKLARRCAPYWAHWADAVCDGGGRGRAVPGLISRRRFVGHVLKWRVS
jgi:isopentenyldiphosphate isomerase